MPAYIIIRIAADEPGQLKDYQMAASAIIDKYHGRFLARGGQVVTLEGPTESRRVVIIEFPTLADAEAFYRSPEYTAARRLLEGIVTAEFVAVDGLAP